MDKPVTVEDLLSLIMTNTKRIPEMTRWQDIEVDVYALDNDNKEKHVMFTYVWVVLGISWLRHMYVSSFAPTSDCSVKLVYDARDGVYDD